MVLQPEALQRLEQLAAGVVVLPHGELGVRRAQRVGDALAHHVERAEGVGLQRDRGAGLAQRVAALQDRHLDAGLQRAANGEHRGTGA